MRTKRLLGILMTIMMAVGLFQVFTVPSFADTDGYWTDEDYVSETAPDLSGNIYTIDNASELAWIADQVNNSHKSFSGDIFVLSQDIDLSGHFWEPIGTLNYLFCGTFDGNGHTISNMTIGTPSSRESAFRYVGFFGAIDYATIENLRLTNVSIYSYNSSLSEIGGITGYCRNSTMSQCYVGGTINSEGDGDPHYMGGLTGYVFSTTIDNSQANCSIVAENNFATIGVLVGEVSKSDVTITNCYSEGNLSGSGAMYAGGLVGWALGTISDSYSTVNVTGNSTSYAGGLIGSSGTPDTNTLHLENCFSIGTVSGGDRVGGLIGSAGNGSITNCFATGDISASGIVGGLIGHNDYLGSSNVINSYASGDILTTKTSSINQYAGGLIGFQGSGTVSDGFWNEGAIQSVGGLIRDLNTKVGIDRVESDDSIPLSLDEMTDINFAESLNSHEGLWTSIYGINGGYPYLEGLYFTTPANESINTVTFISHDGDYKTVHIETGNTVDPPDTNPTRLHYIFEGWYTADDETGEPFDFTSEITSDTQIYAKWEAIPTYTVTYDANWGTGAVPVDSELYEEGDNVTLSSGSDLTRDGYRFKGWTLSSEGSGTVYDAGESYTMGSGDVTFYAKWNEAYTVTYDINGGTGAVPVNSDVYEEGKSVTLSSGSDLTRDGYRFKGWTLSSEGSGTVYETGDTYTMGSGNVTFYAKWNKTYKVTYNANGGTGTVPVDNNTYESGDEIILQAGDGLANEPLNLAGWTLSDDGSGVIYTVGSRYTMGNSNVDFYAKWTDGTAGYWTDIGNISEPDELNDTFYIKNASELAWIAAIVNSGIESFDGYTFKIDDSVSEIDLSRHFWIPIGIGDCEFEGNFDGNNKIISNLTIGTSESPENGMGYYGLFGEIYEATITDIILDEVNIYSTEEDACLGGLAGIVNESVLENCSASGNISGGIGSYIGGLTGEANGDCTIEHCYAYGTVEGEDDVTAGGLIGYTLGNPYENSLIYCCGASVDVIGGNDAFVGGLLGAGEICAIENCYASGDVEGGNDGWTAAGGLAGGIMGSEIKYCSSDSYVTAGDGNPAVGGLLGFSLESMVSNCSAIGHVEGGEDSILGGFAGVNSCFPDGFSGIGNSYAAGNVQGDMAAIIGGFIGQQESIAQECYWNGDEVQIGIGDGEDDSVRSRSAIYMRSDSFVEDLNYEGIEQPWRIVPGLNSGYPVIVDTYNVSVLSSPSLGGTVSDSGSYYAGAVVTLEAEPNDGYVFSNWTEGNTIISTDNPYTFTLGDENRTIAAIFTESPVELSDNADLSNLAASDIIFTPVFTSNVTSYSANVGNSVESTVITATLDDSNATMTINDAETTSKAVNLSVGTNIITIQVIAEDGVTTETYTLTINRSGSDSSGRSNNNSGDNNNEKEANIIVESENSYVKAITTTTTTTNSSGKAAASVTNKQIEDAVTKALENADHQSGRATLVEIKVETDDDANSVEVSIPRTAMESVADNGINAVTISTPVANLTFDQDALDGIVDDADGDIKIIAEKVDSQTLSEGLKQVVGDRPVYDFSVTSGGNTISQFTGNVTVAVPYTLQPGEDPNAIVIYYINDSGEAEMVSDCVYDPDTGMVIFNTDHFSQYAVGHNKVDFMDVTESDWYYDAVAFIAARGITTGKGNGSYGPIDKLTRGQLLVMIMRAYGIEPDERLGDNFADAGDTYYTDYLAAAKEMDITKGVGNNLFAPNREITRQEMFTLLYNVLKELNKLPEISDEIKLSDFNDRDQIAVWAEEAMAQFVKSQIISGNENRLNPAASTNRAEMAQVLYKLLSAN